MSEQDNFLARWSRRKRAAGEAADAADGASTPTRRRSGASAHGARSDRAAATARERPSRRSISRSLPPIEFDHRRDRHPRLPCARRSGRT